MFQIHAIPSVGKHLGIDLHAALRQFRHAPRVALGAIALLTLGIAGVMTLFVPLRSIVLSPLPFPDSDQLVVVGTPVLDLYTTSFPNRRSLDLVFSGIASYRTTEATLSSEVPPVRTAVTAVTSEFFATMGMPPWRGGDFARSPVAASVAVVGYELWRTRLGEAQDLSECAIMLNGARLDVVGVAQPGFDFPDGTQVWIPPKAPNSGSRADWTVIGRLRPGLSVSPAIARLRTIAINAPGVGALFQPKVAELQPLRTYLLGERRNLLWILWSISVLFFFLACAGVANLLWAHGLRRRQEMATRLALGASRARLVGQLLTETCVLAVAGASLGIGVSMLGIRFLERVVPATGGERVILASPASIGLMLAVVLVATVLCGLAPALQATGAGLRAPLRTGNISVNAAVFRRRKISVPELLAGVQLATAMVLLVCTALLLRSLTAKLRLPLGFEPQDVALFQADIPPLPKLLEAERDFYEQVHANPKLGRTNDGVVVVRDVTAYKKAIGPALTSLAARNQAWYAAAMESLAATPGVTAVGTIFPPPFMKGAYQLSAIMEIDPSSGSLREDYTLGLMRGASAETFRLLGIHVLAGRTFLPQEAAPPRLTRSLMNRSDSGSDAAIVNETLARRFWPNQNPIGREFHCIVPRTVVGVVSDIHESSDKLEVQPTVYLPSSPLDRTWTFVVKLRPGTPLSLLAATVRSNLTALIPGLPPPTVVRLADLVAEPLRNLRLGLILLACFAVLGTAVAGLGVYATASEVAATRTQEMGVRVALGATASQIRRFAVWRSFRVVLVALPVGAFGSWTVARSLSHWLFQVGSFDPISSLACATILIVVAFVAGLRPAFRAAAVDPAAALRCDG